MKKIISIMLAMLLSYTLVFAEGGTNIDGGGTGGMGGGTGGAGGSFWNPGNEGVRITLVDSKSGWLVKHSIDMSNKKAPSNIVYFGKVSKLYYARISQTLKPTSKNYSSFTPDIPLPIIISSASRGKSDINQIRRYFAAKSTLQFIAQNIGMDYTEMTSGRYKLLIEPIVYLTFNGAQYAMTATEAACYDKMIGGKLRAKMVSLTHKNLPLSMFLQTGDLNFPAWGGGTNTKQDNDRIILALGVGIIYFDEAPPPPTETVTGDLEYPIDTDVITTVFVEASPKLDYTPTVGASLNFSAPNGQNITKPFICPKGDRQMMWFKWHTPSTPQTVQLGLSGVVSGSMKAVIVDRAEKEPPDPKYADPNPRFRLQRAPTQDSNLQTTWYQWEAVWKAKPRPGYWAFYRQDYSATLNVKYDLLPADRVKTEVNLGFDNWEMKSAYGLEAKVEVHVSGEGGVTSSDITPVQHVEAIFPEFNYKTYNRFLKPENSARYHTTWHFKSNRYSYYLDPVHFVPLWYPDATDFPVPITVTDAWTPGGLLHASVSDKVVIDGGTAYDDWYIRIIRDDK